MMRQTMSFVAYMLRMQPEVFRPHFTAIPRFIIYLLTACPGESVTIRRVRALSRTWAKPRRVSVCVC